MAVEVWASRQKKDKRCQWIGRFKGAFVESRSGGFTSSLSGRRIAATATADLRVCEVEKHPPLVARFVARQSEESTPKKERRGVL